jgi:DNA-binding MarR family transcriptional regulator
LCLISSLPKGESMGTKLVERFANRVDERRNIINAYLKGRACIESVRGVDFRGSVEFELFLLF